MAKLEEVARSPRAIVDGPFGSNLARQHYTESGPRVVRLQNIGEGRFLDAQAHISEDHFKSLRKHEVIAGDLLVASLGDPVLRACLAPASLGPAIVKADCIRIRLDETVNSQFVLHSLENEPTKKWAAAHSHGVGRMRLGLKVIRALPIALPPLDEQRRVVEIVEEHLTSLDASKASVRNVLRRLQAFVKATLLDLIPDVSAYPTTWRNSTVAQAGLIDLGRQRHPDWHQGANMRPYLRVANVFEDRIDTSDLKAMHWDGDIFERFRLRDGDVLLNEGQSPDLLGRPAIYRGEPKEVAFTNSLLRFRASGDVLPEFALLVFRRHMHAGRFRRESRITTNIAHLSASRLKPIEFPIPPLDEQQAIVNEARNRFDAVAALQASVDQTVVPRAAALRRAVLQAAFSGRLTGHASDLDRAEELAS